MYKNLIYSKRYELPSSHNQHPNETEYEENSFFKKILNAEYEECPEKEENKKVFLEASMDFTKSLEIDIDIYERNESIEAILYFQNCPIMGSAKESFINLLKFSDEIIILPINNIKYDSCLSLRYFTHKIKF